MTSYTEQRRAERAGGQAREGDFPGLGEAAVITLRATDPKDGPRLVRMSDVTPERVSWIWRGYLPAGKLTVIDGDPGDGKSTLTIDLIARLSTGSPMPDGTPCPPGNVLALSAEDGIADTIRPRLDAAGADSERVAVLDEIVEDGRGRPVELPGDLPRLAVLIREHRVRLVVIDPLMAFLAGVDSHNDQSIRRALHPLSKLAEATGAAVLVVRHLNKASGGKALYRGGGSIGITGAARAVHLVAPDPDDESRRLLAPVKVNITRKPPTVAYRLVPDELHGCARVQWEGTSPHTADQLVNIPDAEEQAERVSAADFLALFLADGPHPTREVEDAAEQAHGISVRTLKRARATLGVTAHKVGPQWWLELPNRANEGGKGATPDEWPSCTLDGPLAGEESA